MHSATERTRANYKSGERRQIGPGRVGGRPGKASAGRTEFAAPKFISVRAELRTTALEVAFIRGNKDTDVFKSLARAALRSAGDLVEAIRAEQRRLLG